MDRTGKSEVAVTPRDTTQIDTALDELRADFLAGARDRLDEIEDGLWSLENPEVDAAEELLTIRREIHSIKGMGTTFGFPSITIIAHRLEDYLADVESPGARHVEDIAVFLDHMRDIVNLAVDPGAEATDALVRSLPVNFTFNVDDVQTRNVEILLVIPARTVAHFVSSELRACGYRLTMAATPVQALELTILMKPDLIVTAMVMEHLSGIDLARAIRAMSNTEHIPMALLTSTSACSPELRRLPPDVEIIRLGNHLGDDLARVIARFESA